MRRPVAVAGICLLIATGAVSCSGDAEKKPSGRASLARPVKGGTVRTVQAPDQPGPLVDLIAKQVRAAGTVRAEIIEHGSRDGQPIDIKTTAQLRTDTPSPVAQMTIVDSGSADPGTVEAVLSGGSVHVRVDGEEQAPGKPWAQLSREDLERPELGEFAKLLTGLMDQVDQAMREISTDTGLNLVRHGELTAAPVGEKLDGATARKYVGVTKTSALGSDPAYKAMSEAGLREILWKLWVDDKALPRRLQLDASAPKGQSMSTTVTYRDWGGAVLIEVPPAGKVSKIGD